MSLGKTFGVMVEILLQVLVIPDGHNTRYTLRRVVRFPIMLMRERNRCVEVWSRT